MGQRSKRSWDCNMTSVFKNAIIERFEIELHQFGAELAVRHIPNGRHHELSKTHSSPERQVVPTRLARLRT